MCFALSLWHVGITTPVRRPHFKSCLGFTLTEVIIAGAVLALFVVGSVTAMTQVNRWAYVARLRTLALAVAQQKVDQILMTSWSVLETTPTILTAGTTTESNLPLNYDTFNSESGLSSAYTTLGTPETVNRTTQITTIGTRQVRAW